MVVCRVPKGLEDVSTYPALFTALLATDTWTVEELKKLAGLNFLRVMRTVEQVSHIGVKPCRLLKSWNL